MPDRHNVLRGKKFSTETFLGNVRLKPVTLLTEGVHGTALGCGAGPERF